MKLLYNNFIAAVFLFGFSTFSITQAALWVSGSNLVNQPGVYGTQNVPSPDNMPGSRRESMSWTDAAGNFWLFGGWSSDGGYLNDLWKFDGANWTWVGGENTTSQPGSYGLQGVPNSDNMPGARGAGVCWRDGRGNVWLFGGSGYAARSNIWGVLNDFWRFDGANWTWIGGSTDYLPQAGTYGVQGQANPSNMPGGRYGGVAWIDHGDNLWLFGGWGYDSMKNAGWLNDLWKFDGANWTWVSGADTINQPGVYGTQGAAAPENTPGSRWGSVSWIDANDNLWLFGGVGNWGMNFNDLWKFDGVNWTWVSGSNLVNQPGFYGTQGVAGPANMPGARDHSVSWIDRSGNLWLFGGWSLAGYFNDLWKFDGANWTWVDGSDAPNELGIYGTQGVEGLPGARWAAAAWIDGENNLWLFGGWNSLGYFNDLWSFTIEQPAGLAASQNEFTGLTKWAAAWFNYSDIDLNKNSNADDEIEFDQIVTLTSDWCDSIDSAICVSK